MTFIEDLIDALLLIFSSSEIWSITTLSIFISTTAVLLSCLIGIPIGLVWGLRKSQSSTIAVTLLQTGMALPPVVVGLVVYLFLYRQGPLGELSLLFTPLAMILAQTILTLPIIIGLTRSTIKDLPSELSEMLVSLGATKTQKYLQIIEEARSGILVAIIVALGRAFSEVGAILIVGGNIRYSTRVLTTAIITEVGMGQQVSALALGLLLLTISFSLILMITSIQIRKPRK